MQSSFQKNIEKATTIVFAAMSLAVPGCDLKLDSGTASRAAMMQPVETKRLQDQLKSEVVEEQYGAAKKLSSAGRSGAEAVTPFLEQALVRPESYRTDWGFNPAEELVKIIRSGDAKSSLTHQKIAEMQTEITRKVEPYMLDENSPRFSKKGELEKARLRKELAEALATLNKMREGLNLVSEALPK